MRALWPLTVVSTVEGKANSSEVAALTAAVRALRAALADRQIGQPEPEPEPEQETSSQSGSWGSDTELTLEAYMREAVRNAFAGANCCPSQSPEPEPLEPLEPLATCGDTDGGGGGAAAVSDGDCGAGFIYDSSASGSLCVGTACDVAGVVEDKTACCAAQATCGDANGEGAGVTAVSDSACGAGFLYDSSASAAFCAGTACDIAGTAADKTVCCNMAPFAGNSLVSVDQAAWLVSQLPAGEGWVRCFDSATDDASTPAVLHAQCDAFAETVTVARNSLGYTFGRHAEGAGATACAALRA